MSMLDDGEFEQGDGSDDPYYTEADDLRDDAVCMLCNRLESEHRFGALDPKCVPASEKEGS